MCDYAIEVTNGTRPLDLVPVAVRHPLLITWTRVKQLLSQQIHKNLGAEDEVNLFQIQNSSSFCIAIVFVPKVESGEQTDVPKVKLGEQIVKGHAFGIFS